MLSGLGGGAGANPDFSSVRLLRHASHSLVYTTCTDSHVSVSSFLDVSIVGYIKDDGPDGS
jgi:hypothetical protein